MTDVLALIEHVDRELDVVCLLQTILKERRGIKLKVANFYADAPFVLAGPAPRVVVTPFFYAAEDLVMRDYVAAWPETRFVNLAWEQLFYPSHQAIKLPRDDFARQQVTHLAWSRLFVEYLQKAGVQPDRVKLVGHSLYRLYREPYRAYFQLRSQLAARHGLDQEKPWIFVPENYRWAFFTDSKLRKLSNKGVAVGDLFEMRDYCRTSLRALAEWCQALAERGEAEVIFRPRPATSTREISDFFRSELGLTAPAFRLMKQESAREWVLAADHVASSYSTVLIEAALAGKAITKVEPAPIPAALRYEWCELVPGVSTQAEFLAACTGNGSLAGTEALRTWAEETFLPGDDPVVATADAIAAEVEAARAQHRRPTSRPSQVRVPGWLRLIEPVLSPVNRHRLCQRHGQNYAFNWETHEKDLFSQADVRQRASAWARCRDAV